jgi:virulence-associated protein VagC
MKLPVTESGVTLPKAWFGDAKEVEVRRENGHVKIAPVDKVGDDVSESSPVPADDPLWKLFECTSDLPITDASVNLDKYLYDFDR